MKSDAKTFTEAQYKALLVIDVQEDYTGRHARPPFPYENSEQFITSINRLIAKASEQDFAIVYITQEFDGFIGKTFSKLLFHGTAIKGNPGTEIDSRIKIVSENRFPKSKPDAFSNPALKSFLDREHIRELYLVGLDAAFCLDKTAREGIRQGCKVTVIHDCVVTNFEKRWIRLRQKYDDKEIALISSHEFLNEQ